MVRKKGCPDPPLPAPSGCPMIKRRSEFHFMIRRRTTRCTNLVRSARRGPRMWSTKWWLGHGPPIETVSLSF